MSANAVFLTKPAQSYSHAGVGRAYEQNFSGLMDPLKRAIDLHAHNYKFDPNLGDMACSSMRHGPQVIRDPGL